MTSYVARAAVVKVAVGSATGHRMAHILRAGDVVPDGVDPALLQHLSDRGLIEQLPEPELEPETSTKSKPTRTRGRAKGGENPAGQPGEPPADDKQEPPSQPEDGTANDDGDSPSEQ